MFIKYQHIERLDSTECEGLLDGLVHVFPKIDGTNASVWFDLEKGIRAGSRNRILSPESDNAGFCKFAYNDENLIAFFYNHKDFYRLYGEWLVPHSLKTYRDDAWRRFYVFDVLDTQTNEMLSYEAYKPILEAYDLDYLAPIATIKDPQPEHLLRLLDKNTHLIKDGEGKGEGIVCKNYDYINRFGRQTWGKIITNEFKEKHHKEMGAPEINNTLFVEEVIVRDFLTEAFILKEKSKIELTHDGWSSRHIGELLGRVWYEFIREETWNFIKEHKNPKINFKVLNGLVIKKVKQVVGI